MSDRTRPSALAAFLRKDQAARLLLVGVLAAGAATVLSGTPDAAVAPPRPDLVEGGVELVRFHVTAERLGELSVDLASSARACLGDQATMLETVAGSDAHAGLDALEARSRALRAHLEGDALPREANRVLDAAWLTKPQEERLAAHLSLREACLSWAERSVVALTGSLTSDSRTAFEAARAVAARDAAMVRAIEQGGVPEDAESLERMETAAPRP